MIKWMETVKKESDGWVVTLFADTKDEVAETGAATTVSDFFRPLKAGSLIYTADRKAALLKSNDNWEWGD